MSPSEQVYRPAAAPRVAERLSGPEVDGGRPAPGPGLSAGVRAEAPRPEMGRMDHSPGMAPSAPAGPRKVRLTLARVDPWSVLKLSFLLSVALGIGTVTASVILWSVVNSMGVFDSLNKVLGEIAGPQSNFNLLSYVGLGRVVSLSIFISVIDVLLLMALSTVGAFLYNIAASLVGGVQVTLSDD